MATAYWLFHSEQSPAYEYAIFHTSIGNVLTDLNLPALFLGIAASGNVHQPSEIATYLGIFVQWVLIGSVASWLIIRLASITTKGQGDA